MSPKRKNIAEADYEILRKHFEDTDTFQALACLLIIFTGARSNEILRITHRNIMVDEKAGEIVRVSLQIIASKRGRNRVIDLPEELFARIKDLREELKEQKLPLAGLIVLNPTNHQSTIDSAYESTRLYLKAVQLELFGEARYTLHSFRHTLAVRALKAGHNIIELKALLGHDHINSTYEYLKEYEAGVILSGVSRLVRGNGK